MPVLLVMTGEKGLSSYNTVHAAIPTWQDFWLLRPNPRNSSDQGEIKNDHLPLRPVFSIPLRVCFALSARCHDMIMYSKRWCRGFSALFVWWRNFILWRSEMPPRIFEEGLINGGGDTNNKQQSHDNCCSSEGRFLLCQWLFEKFAVSIRDI